VCQKKAKNILYLEMNGVFFLSKSILCVFCGPADNIFLWNISVCICQVELFKTDYGTLTEQSVGS
jgi:hypothetical protein